MRCVDQRQERTMKTVFIIALVCVGSLATTWPTTAGGQGRKGPPGNKKGAEDSGAIVVNARSPASATSTAATTSKEPWVHVNVVISDDERRVIRGYVDHCNAPDARGRKGQGLPPGLAKKVARGKGLPPGWQKKCVGGQIMPVEVYEHCHPLPPELVVKLPPPPPGTITVTIGGKVVRLVKATREILDVFDVHVRL